MREPLYANLRFVMDPAGYAARWMCTGCEGTGLYHDYYECPLCRGTTWLFGLAP